MTRRRRSKQNSLSSLLSSFIPKKVSDNAVSWILKASLIGIVVLFVLGLGVFALFSRNLPEPGKVLRNDGTSTVFYDRNDKVLFQMFEDKNRIPVKIDEVPDYLKQATIAVEDKNFYTHSGFSVWGYVRSVFRIATTGKLAGGSTLTQQLVKNVLLTQERTVTRKIKELVLAVAIEKRFTKDEILEMYLNESPYGGTYYGVQSAAKGYFDKDVNELNLIESAIIAGLPQRPSVYNPINGKKDAFKGRTKDVLRRMEEDGYISKDEHEKALKDLETVEFKGEGNIAIQAPHFVFYVRNLVAEKFGDAILNEGLHIKTTLDLDQQEDMQDVVSEEIEKILDLNATNGSLVALDTKTGEILAMVGSYDYNNKEYGRFNTATALRQPGSAIKPITYATAFTEGYSPASLVMDVETEFPNQGAKSYTPVNYDGKFRGPVQYRYALANSYNVPAVKVLANVGIDSFLQTAYDMGLDTFEPTKENMQNYGLAATLGGAETTLLDLTAAYSVFARGGTYMEPTAILEIKDNKGKKIYEAPKPVKKEVLSEGVSFLISHILSDNVARSEAFGPNSYLNIPGKTVAVKTGTTNSKRDNWTVGFTNDVTVGVWVGNNDNTPMNQKIASGLTGASPIWSRAIKSLLATYSDGIMKQPDSVEALQIDALLGGLPKDGSPIRSEYFIKGLEPKDISPFYQSVKISKSTGKLANEVEIRSGDYEEKDYIVITESDPVSTDGRNRWQEAINEWAKNQDNEIFKVPTEVSDAKGEDIRVTIRAPKDTSRSDSNKVRVQAKIASIEKIKEVELIVNGNVVKKFSGDTKEIDEELDLPEGTYKISVRAKNEKDKSDIRDVRIGVKVDWDSKPEEPTAEPTESATPTP